MYSWGKGWTRKNPSVPASHIYGKAIVSNVHFTTEAVREMVAAIS